MSRTQRYIIAGVLTCLLFISLGLSQSTFGSITGSVKDPTGSVVPAADVEVTNDGTGSTRRVTTSSSGVFNAPNLDIGSYKVRVSGKGFTTYERGGLNLIANQIISVDVQLALGATTTLVEVRGASPIITTEANDLSGLV